MKAARSVTHSPGYGLGWQVSDYRGHRLFWHSGNADGQQAYMALMPDDSLGVARDPVFGQQFSTLVNFLPGVDGAIERLEMDLGGETIASDRVSEAAAPGRSGR